jgi:hypothetical protein
MAAKKTTTTKTPGKTGPADRSAEGRTPQTVPGTVREHRMVDAEKMRDDVKKRGRSDGS